MLCFLRKSRFFRAAITYRFSGSGCRAATTPPRAAAEHLARTAHVARSFSAAEHGATRRSATSSTRLNSYATSAAAALFLASPAHSLAEGSSSEAVVLFEAGQPKRFEIARDELHFRDRTGAAWLQALPAERTMERLRARAAGLMAASGAADVKLVLYPAGRPRSDATRRLL